MKTKFANVIKYFLDTTQLGFYHLSLIFSKGFFFYFYGLFYLISKIIPLGFIKKIRDFFRKKQSDPVAFLFLILLFLIGVFLHTYLYVDKNDVMHIDESIINKDDKEEVEKPQEETSDKETYSSNEINLFRKYGGMSLDQVSFSDLKKTNNDVVAWLQVDGTSVNYPITQYDNNDYYLNHDIVKNPKASGWTFMDYRNAPDMSDSNTIFYGHNLLNRTSFGSLANVFTDKWFNSSNHYIVVLTESGRFVYQIFSCYFIDPEVYYLQNNFYNDDEHQKFIDTIMGRSKYNFGVRVSVNDKIITLSTCTEDNKGRKVIHAKLIEN